MGTHSQGMDDSGKQQLKQVIFDFQETVFMDSSGIGVIMGRYRNMGCLGGKVSAVHVGERIHRIFRLSGLYKLIPVNREAIWSHKRGIERRRIWRTPMK